jgi:hypothetical protein
MPQIGDKRFFVEYLDRAKGVAAIKEGGGDVDHDTMWDYCSQDEIDTSISCETKEAAIAWAATNSALDVFNMPRIREDTWTERPGDRLHFTVKGWEGTGYWEADGTTEIDPSID